jgi:hypothetical protein
MPAVSSARFGNSVPQGHASPWAHAGVRVSGAVVVAALRGRRAPLAAPPPPPATASANRCDEVLLNGRVSGCAWTALVLSGLLAVGSGIAVGIPWDASAGMPHWLICTLSEAALVIPGVILVAAMRAVPAV